MMSRFIAIALLTLLTSTALAGKYNSVLDIGDKAPAWKELPGVDGKKHSLDDLKDCDAVVVFFTCNSCPYAVEYEDRSIALTKAFKDKNVAVVAINVNKVAADSFEKMQEKAKAKKFNFAYLYDESQQIAKDFGALFTPEFFVLDGERKIAYMGALDDNTAPDKVKVQHVANALNAILSGNKVETTETVAIGCRIRMERRRRPRN